MPYYFYHFVVKINFRTRRIIDQINAKELMKKNSRMGIPKRMLSMTYYMYSSKEVKRLFRSNHDGPMIGQCQSFLRIEMAVTLPCTLGRSFLDLEAAVSTGSTFEAAPWREQMLQRPLLQSNIDMRRL